METSGQVASERQAPETEPPKEALFQNKAPENEDGNSENKASENGMPDDPDGIVLFGKDFCDQWTGRSIVVNEDDQLAAAKLHIQLVSRITTQRLPYIDGEEVTALTSVYKLFEEAREVFKKHPKSGVTDAVVWHVMNTRVRLFTAKWHRQSERGALAALDATDIFRHELTVLQKYLVRFDALLVAIRDEADTVTVSEPGNTGREAKIEAEMQGKLCWKIDEKLGGLDESTAKTINAKEKIAVNARRAHYSGRRDLISVAEAAETWAARSHATALAISGGGIRSATFALGVLAALARRNLLYQFDYLSTVSGGGYLGAFLTTFLSTSLISPKPQIGLGREDLPFRRKDGEPAALRHVRHHSKYLATGRLWERLQMASAQVYGMAMNWLGFAYLAFVVALVEQIIRSHLPDVSSWKCLIVISVGAIAAVALLIPLFRRLPVLKQGTDALFALSLLIFLGLLAWKGLSYLHDWLAVHSRQEVWPWLILLAALPLVASAALALIGSLSMVVRIPLTVIAAVAAPLLFLGIEFLFYDWLDKKAIETTYAIVIAVLGYLLFWRLFDINFTAPHRFYKQKLGEAYLVRPEDSSDPTLLRKNVSLKLSECNDRNRSPYHLVNCALNVPASDNPRMQGRLTEFFLFSRDFCGSPLTGYEFTTTWEGLNPGLDLGTAMAISGAAAAPQMGLGTIKNLSFWMALFNIRLGFWVKKPKITIERKTTPAAPAPAVTAPVVAAAAAATTPSTSSRESIPEVIRNAVKSVLYSPPGLMYLLREMFGKANEKRAYVNVSDGGHIENLGVYELLRRRCKYIVAIDGEQDQAMTFQGLTTLLRLAYIDLGVTIDVGLDALRLAAASGLSHSHFAFCRIRYPRDERGGEESYGYLLYLKLSLTGNEGEFIKRYKLDEPAFPHTSTANQFFSEAQFEAYRSLGEHVGDKMFLPAIVGDMANSDDVALEKWFEEIGKNMLEPLPPKKPSPSKVVNTVLTPVAT